MKKLFKNIRAVSPVIATIIIVAIAIVMAIAVAYWMLGLGASFTKYEKVEFLYAYPTNLTSIELKLKNSGSAPATIDTSVIFANGKLLPANAFVNSNSTLTMQPGDWIAGTLNISSQNIPSGTTVEISIQTTAGKQYPKVITLP